MVQIQNIKSKILLLIVALLFTSQSYAVDVTIPDAAFKTYLVANANINTNSDTEIQVSEANAYNGVINCASLSITDVTGIEAFISLTSLYCQYNNISNLDLSSNTALQSLNCANSGVSTLNINNLASLLDIMCSANNLSRIDFSTNTSLTDINCRENPISILDLSNNTYNKLNRIINSSNKWNCNCKSNSK